MSSELVGIIAAVSAGVLTLVTVFFTGAKRYLEEWLALRVRRLKRENYGHGLEKLAQFKKIIESIKDLPNVGRVLLFIGRNGGGLPTPGKAYSVKSIFGFSKKDEKVEERYNFRLQVDSHYIEMLAKMIKEGFVHTVTEKMSDEAVQKSFYQDEGIKESCIFFLAVTGIELTFLSVGTYDQPLSAIEIARLEIVVSRLRALIAEGNDQHPNEY